MRAAVLFLVRGAVATGLAVAVAAQAPPPARGTAIVVGQVVDGDTGQGIADAVVFLSGPAGPGPAAPGAGGPRVLTDSRGRFYFAGLAAGDYSVSASKSGYATGAFGSATAAGGRPSTLELSDGEARLDARIVLWRLATIAGRVVDETGEPLVGVGVRVLRGTMGSGRWRFSYNAEAATTDDRGVYRLSGLRAGDYVVVVPSVQTTLPAAVVDDLRQRGGDPAGAEWEWVTRLPALPPAASGAMRRAGNAWLLAGRAVPSPPLDGSGRTLVYPAAFHPLQAGGDRPVSIPLRPGEEHAAADIVMRPVPGVTVAGTVRDADGPVGLAAVRLVPVAAGFVRSEEGLEAATTLSDPLGRFTFLNVADGRYVLRAMKLAPPQPPGAPRAAIQTPDGGLAPLRVPGATAVAPAEPARGRWAEVTVGVAGRDASDLDVFVRPGLRLSGRVEFTGTAERPAGVRPVIAVDRADGRMTEPPSETFAGADLTFLTDGVPPGRYLVTVGNIRPPWSLESVMWRGRDLSAVPFDLVEEDLDGVVVTVTDRPTRVVGTVRATDGRPDPDAYVVVFPAERDGWVDFGYYPRRLGEVRTRRSGAYAVEGLAPGDYLAAALPPEAVVWRPGFFESLSRVATPFRLDAGGTRVLDLRTRDSR